MGFLLHDDRLRVMEKKLTNSGPLRESVDKHSIYPLIGIMARQAIGTMHVKAIDAARRRDIA